MTRITALILFFVNLILSTKTAVARKAVGVPTTTRWRKSISVRGGAGPLNVKDTAKAATLVFGVQGAFGVLAPAKANEAFGLQSNRLDDFLMKRTSAILLSFVLFVWQLVLKGSGLKTATGIGAIPLIIETLQGLLNGDVTSLGFDALQQYPFLVLESLIAYTCLTGSKYADISVKVSAVLNTVVGLFAYFFPKEFLATFGNKNPFVRTASKLLVRAFALPLLTTGIIASSLLWGKNIDAIKALGYAWSLWVFHTINGFFVNKEFVELRLNQGVLIFWSVFHLIVVGTLAL